MTHLILTYGYLAVFGLVTAEYIGVPLPGETALIVAAAYAGNTHKLSVWAIFALGLVAAIVGDYVGYFVGVKGGYRLLLRWGPLIRLDHAKIKVGWYVFDRHGGKVVFIGRFITVLRTYTAFLAGTNRMRWGRFSVFNVAGGIAWAALYTFVSYYAGQLLSQMSTLITIIGLAGGAVVIVIVTLLMRRGTVRLTERAEAAFPGPLDHARSAGHRAGQENAHGATGKPGEAAHLQAAAGHQAGAAAGHQAGAAAGHQAGAAAGHQAGDPLQRES